MGHGALAGMTLQGLAVTAEQMDLKAGTEFHGDDLILLAGHEAPLLRQSVQGPDLLPDGLGQLLVVGADGILIPEDAGQQQSFHLDLGGGEGDLLNNISFIRIIPHGRIAFNAAVVRDGLAQGKTVQHGGNVSGF